MKPKNFILDFTIPQGPTGPTGPNGPANGLNAYGGIYNFNAEKVNVEKDRIIVLPLDGTLISSATDYDEENSITIHNEGVYEISYSADITATADATITLLAMENNVDIASSGTEKIVKGGTTVHFSMNTIYPLEKDSVVNLNIISNSPTEVTINKNANLIVKEID